MHITKRTIDNAVIDSLFKKGGTFNEFLALKYIIRQCEKRKESYTLSLYAEKVLQGGNV